MPAARSRAANDVGSAGGGRELHGEVAAAPLGVRRRQHARAAAELALEQPLEVARQRQRLAPQPLHAGCVEQRERRRERRERQDRRVAELPALGARQRRELRLHEEPPRAVVSPPAGEARQISAAPCR